MLPMARRSQTPRLRFVGDVEATEALGQGGDHSGAPFYNALL